MKITLTSYRHWMLMLLALVAHSFVPLIAQAQPAQRQISGHVRSASEGTPISGASVSLKGTNVAVATNDDGRYTITVPNDGAVLVFTFLGHEAQEVATGQRTTIDITLSPSQEVISEVVVTALGIERETKSLGYSVGTVDGEDLVRVPQTNVINAMSGRIPGVVINQTGGP